MDGRDDKILFPSQDSHEKYHIADRGTVRNGWEQDRKNGVHNFVRMILCCPANIIPHFPGKD
jgi:hypothetical protein